MHKPKNTMKGFLFNHDLQNMQNLKNPGQKDVKIAQNYFINQVNIGNATEASIKEQLNLSNVQKGSESRKSSKKTHKRSMTGGVKQRASSKRRSKLRASSKYSKSGSGKLKREDFGNIQQLQEIFRVHMNCKLLIFDFIVVFSGILA